jgi:dTDP-4-dehydrorhamnose reductase
VARLGLKAKVEPCSQAEFPLPAKRPVNGILENRLLKKQGINVMVDWAEDLDVCLDTHGDEFIKEAKASKK